WSACGQLRRRITATDRSTAASAMVAILSATTRRSSGKKRRKSAARWPPATAMTCWSAATRRREIISARNRIEREWAAQAGHGQPQSEFRIIYIMGNNITLLCGCWLLDAVVKKLL